MPRITALSLKVLCASLLGAGLLAACGGGDDDGGAPTSTVSGSVVKGPVNGANVCAFALAGGNRGSQLRCTTTNATGGYSMDLQYAGDVLIEATGGSYTDEATNTTKTLGDPLQVVVSVNGGTTTGVVTPLTSVAYNLSRGMAGGANAANFGNAANQVRTFFQLSGVNITATVPVVTGTAIDAYGRMLRAVSQYMANGGNLGTFVNFTNPAALQTAFATAYATINNSQLTFTFTTAGTGTGGTGTGGTGTGGGTASCAVTTSGTATVQGMTIAIPATKVCVTGVPAGSCTAANTGLSSVAGASSTPAGAVGLNLSYSYSTDCSGAIATVAIN